MTNPIAGFCETISFDGRIYSLGEYRQAIRRRLDGVIDGFGIAVAVCATAAVAAVSIINTVPTIDFNLHTKVPMVRQRSLPLTTIQVG